MRNTKNTIIVEMGILHILDLLEEYLIDEYNELLHETLRYGKNEKLEKIDFFIDAIRKVKEKIKNNELK